MLSTRWRNCVSLHRIFAWFCWNAFVAVNVSLSLLHPIKSFAQVLTPIRINASQSWRQPGPAAYHVGTAKSPAGSTLGVNSRYLVRDGKPWLPVVGEFHYSRYPDAGWEEQILKMKASGVNIVATYVFWIHHEEIEGQFDWTGQRDLRRFVELCAKHGMYVEVRIGPWDHGEVRNGGFPDWLIKRNLRTRVNDPVYLSFVRRWYSQIAQQVKGLLWKNGGPIIGIQLENEYANRGEGAGKAHILELKKLAIEVGFDVPFYFVTGWDNAVVPPGAVIPVYGGYPDAPWDASTAKLPPSEVYAFRFHSRVASNMGGIGDNVAEGQDTSTKAPLPYFTAEIGGGLQNTYHRRLVIYPDDVSAMYPVMLGSGVNLYGTYMFQGGENPEGKLSTLQESQATNYPNDVPIKSYDFQAPLGEFGEERESFRKMKVFQYFLNDYGEYLAPMMVHAPELQPANTADFSVPRVAVRSEGDSGFIFLNNYVRNYAMPARPAAQFEIRLPHGTLRVPNHPIDIPSGTYFIWPFNLAIGGVNIRYSTAQLFTHMLGTDTETIYFEEVPGIPVEFDFESKTIKSLQSASGRISRKSGTVTISDFTPGLGSNIDITSSTGEKIRIIVLTQSEAEGAWKILLSGGSSTCESNHLLITKQDFFANGDGGQERVWLQSRGTPDFTFSITPPLKGNPKGTLKLVKTASPTNADQYSANAADGTPDLKYSQIRPAGIAPPVKLGKPPSQWRKGVAEAPGLPDPQYAARWRIEVPPAALRNLSDLYLQIAYVGDVARLEKEDEILTDNFYNGQPWTIGLRRFLDADVHSFVLSIVPLRSDAPIYIEWKQAPVFAANGQADELKSLRLIPEYQLLVTLENSYSTSRSCNIERNRNTRGRD